jgi:hypothetical protein
MTHGDHEEPAEPLVQAMIGPFLTWKKQQPRHCDHNESHGDKRRQQVL